MVPALAPPPPDSVNATIAPPVVNALPAASRAWNVRVAGPPDPTVPLATETMEVTAEIAPGLTVIVGNVEATGAPSIVAWTVVATPARTPVNVAVYVPLPLSVAGDGLIVPVLVPAPPVTLNTTVAPPDVILLPPASLPCSVSVTAPPDCTEPLDTEMSDSAGEIAPDVAVAPNASAGTAGNAGTVAWNVCGPTPEPSVAATLAWPRLSVKMVVSAGVPPAGARNRTPTPATGRLSAARTSTVNGSGSVCPTLPLCPLPE